MYPYDSNYLLRKKKKIKRDLLKDIDNFINKKIAVLGGSTTTEFINMLDIFLLSYEIKVDFYESEYNMYYEDALYSEDLVKFNPDIVYIHTSWHNLLFSDVETEFNKYKNIWKSLSKLDCSIIQNNFDYPSYRLYGNKDCYHKDGKINYINKLNLKFADYASSTNNLFINDINYLSARVGLDEWNDTSAYHMYKYFCAIKFIPDVSFSLSNIIKSIYGKNKKVLTCDLDNTLWGGIVGDDGVEGIEIGTETSLGQVYSEFQSYIKSLKSIGVVLTVNSKNDYQNAIAGLNHPSGILNATDFIDIKANWETKAINIQQTALDLNLGLDSFVFIDDNPAERKMVSQIKSISIPPMDRVEDYIKILDHGGYFEPTIISNDDRDRSKMYLDNAKRIKLQKSVGTYEDYLLSLEMKANIKPFEKIFFPRIAQLTNKSNQFNLTTKRYSESDIESLSINNKYITLYGSLIDTFGDNGIVSIIIAQLEEKDKIAHIDLWLMSCRVLKRNMEHAMLDILVKKLKYKGFNKIKGYYYKTKKNNMVSTLYKDFGFDILEYKDNGDSIWELDITEYKNKNKYIEVINE